METSLSTSEKLNGIIAISVLHAMALARGKLKNTYPPDGTFCAIFSLHQEKDLAALEKLPGVRVLFKSAKAINTNYAQNVWKDGTYWGGMNPKSEWKYAPRNTVVVFEVDEKPNNPV